MINDLEVCAKSVKKGGNCFSSSKNLFCMFLCMKYEIFFHLHKYDEFYFWISCMPKNEFDISDVQLYSKFSSTEVHSLVLMIINSYIILAVVYYNFILKEKKSSICYMLFELCCMWIKLPLFFFSFNSHWRHNYGCYSELGAGSHFSESPGLFALKE